MQLTKKIILDRRKGVQISLEIAYKHCLCRARCNEVVFTIAKFLSGKTYQKEIANTCNVLKHHKRSRNTAFIFCLYNYFLL